MKTEEIKYKLASIVGLLPTEPMKAQEEIIKLYKSLQSNSVTDSEIEKKADAVSGRSAYPKSHNSARDYCAFIEGAEWMRSKLTLESPTDEQEEKELSVEELVKEAVIEFQRYLSTELTVSEWASEQFFKRKEFKNLLTDYKKQLK